MGPMTACLLLPPLDAVGASLQQLTQESLVEYLGAVTPRED